MGSPAPPVQNHIKEKRLVDVADGELDYEREI